MDSVDLVIIGGGSAGLASAISAYDNGVKDILLIEKSDKLGGILNQCIHNGFGLQIFKEELTGPEYAYRFIQEVKKRNIKYLLNTLVTSLNKDKEITFVNDSGIHKIKAKAIIYAAGCNERTYGQISIPGNRPNGVYTAGLAQKYLNIDGYLVGKRVYILGSGDIGLIMARRMTLEGAKVIGVSELMPYSNGLNRNIVQCLNDFNIPLHLSSTVTKIIGKNQLEAIEVCDVDSSFNPIVETKRRIECDTLLLSVGLYPYNGLLENAGCELYKNSKGCKVDQYLETSIEGVFSTGNVLHVHDLVDYVSLESSLAGKSASEYIFNLRGKKIKEINTICGNNLSYLLPNKINVYENSKELIISFRVKKPIKQGYILYKDGNNIIKKQLKLNLIPSEMQRIKVNIDDIKNMNSFEVEIEEKI